MRPFGVAEKNVQFITFNNKNDYKVQIIAKVTFYLAWSSFRSKLIIWTNQRNLVTQFSITMILSEIRFLSVEYMTTVLRNDNFMINSKQ